MLEFTSILAVGLVGGALPLLARWSDRQFHGALALSTGVFLGAVFLHLLPVVAADAGTGGHAHVAGVAEEHAHDDGHTHEDGHDHEHEHDGGEDHDRGDGAEGDDAHAGHVHGDVRLWIFVLAGVLGVFLIESLLLPGHGHAHGMHGESDAEHHSAVGWAALLGLSVHALTAGVALAAASENAEVAGVMLLAILAHKGFESFSLASVFAMTTSARSRVLLLVVLFSLVTPLGFLLGDQVSSALGADGIAMLTALAAGTFLYVCLCELLPEVFHHREDVALKTTLLVGGVVLMGWLHEIGGI